MANSDRARGFQPRKTKNGGPFTNLIRKIAVAARGAGVGNRLFIGDPIAVSDTGVVTVALSAGIDAMGVIVGIATDSIDHGEQGMWNADNLEKRYLEDTEAGFVWYVPVDDVLFEIQTGADLDLLVGMGADFGITTTDFTVAVAHGDAVTGWSSLELSSANAAAGDVRVVEDVTTPDNDATLTNARHMVAFLNTRFGSDSG